MRGRGVLAAAMLAAPLLGAVPPARLTLAVDGLRSGRGNVLICLTAAPAHFPDCRGDPGAHRLTVPAGQAQRLEIADLAPGDYALALIHDENGNGRLDTRLMIPVEGFGFSRNPPIGFGPPSFARAAFSLHGDADQRVRMRYLL